MKNKIGVVVLVIIIIAALGFIVKQAMPKKTLYTVVLIDVESKKAFQKSLDTDAEQIHYPLQSPYTGKNTAYPALKCMQCGAIFPYILEESASVTMPKCPKCSSSEVRALELPKGTKEIDVN